MIGLAIAVFLVCCVLSDPAQASVYAPGGLSAGDAAWFFAQLALAWFAGYWVGSQIRMVRLTAETF